MDSELETLLKAKRARIRKLLIAADHQRWQWETRRETFFDHIVDEIVSDLCGKGNHYGVTD